MAKRAKSRDTGKTRFCVTGDEAYSPDPEADRAFEREARRAKIPLPRASADECRRLTRTQLKKARALVKAYTHSMYGITKAG